ncbi:hypothetical protein CY34DRAFT_429306 [Suillus luteus UH-Slu-Lm8-n1]|uniref:Uncharacterized protein n=1 Tax=Suillus luteus UH-Slu-Lm8-n1 TaxID=930992 RepID=A0A0D0AFM2_9AGAM|nr:hypothetical protein CY34DRAFT_429306 [Suillus luteus UH-Slu-Lm8-n1]
MSTRPCFGDSFALSPSLIASLSAAVPLSWYGVAAKGSTGWCYSCVGSHSADRGGISRLLLRAWCTLWYSEIWSLVFWLCSVASCDVHMLKAISTMLLAALLRFAR